MKARKNMLKSMLMAVAFQAMGFDATLTVNPPLISLGESAQIRVEVRNAKRPQLPNFPDIDGLRFAGTGKSSNTSFINGKIDKSVSYTVNIYPERTGEFLIGPFDYTVDKQTVQLQGRLKVVSRSGDKSKAQSWSDVVFGKIQSDRSKVYVQEPFELKLSIYSRTDIQLSGNISLDGLPQTGISEPEWEEVPYRQREQIDGVLYNVRQFKTSMRTMGSGKFEFSPMATVHVVAPRQQRRHDPFGFFNSVQTIPVELAVEKTTVDVRPLPLDGKPDNFSGAVGRFELEVKADPTEVHPGDPITLHMIILGEGNYDRIMPPKLPVDAPFRVFGDAVREQGKNGVRFEQAISPRNASVTEIPPISFSFFDSQNEKYRTLYSPVIPITVTASSNDTAQLFVAKDAIKVAPADQPFATESDMQRILDGLLNLWRAIRPWLWTVPVVIVLAGIGFGATKLHRHRKKDTARLRRQQAPKAARKALKAADKAIQNNQPTAYFEAVGQALTSYFGHRFNLAPGEVTSVTVLEKLKGSDNSAVSEEKITQIQQLFETVEASRYGMMDSKEVSDEMKVMRKELGTMLQTIDKVKL